MSPLSKRRQSQSQSQPQPQQQQTKQKAFFFHGSYYLLVVLFLSFGSCKSQDTVPDRTTTTTINTVARDTDTTTTTKETQHRQAQEEEEEEEEEEDEELRYANCNFEDYYRDMLEEEDELVSMTRENLHSIVSATHRNRLPALGLTLEEEDVYQAIMDLDPGYESTPSPSDNSPVRWFKNETVRLIYSDQNMARTPYANFFSWDLERFWSPLNSYSQFQHDMELFLQQQPTMDWFQYKPYTDVHGIKPVDSSVSRIKNKNLQITNYGHCQQYDNNDDASSSCVTPATSKTTSDTFHDGDIWTPPKQSRGDIARALLYMDLRYGTPTTTTNAVPILLSLGDCPPFGTMATATTTTTTVTNRIGYLSQLLTWNLLDPVDDYERYRNDRVCKRWQGNRNPFIDFYYYDPILPSPITGRTSTLTTTKQQSKNIQASTFYKQMVENIFGKPQSPSSCLPPPTPSPTVKPNLCTRSIRVGEIPFFIINSATTTTTTTTTPDYEEGDSTSTTNQEEIILFSLISIPPGLELFLTDNEWDGNQLRTNEGTLSMIVPEEGIQAGTFFGYSGGNTNTSGNSSQPQTIRHSNLWKTVGNGRFGLNGNGDNLFLYCLNAEYEPHFISGISYNNYYKVDSNNNYRFNPDWQSSDLLQQLQPQQQQQQQWEIANYNATNGNNITISNNSSMYNNNNIGLNNSTNDNLIAGILNSNNNNANAINKLLLLSFIPNQFFVYDDNDNNRVNRSYFLFLSTNYENNLYEGPLSGSRELLKQTFYNTRYWTGTNDARFQINFLQQQQSQDGVANNDNNNDDTTIITSGNVTITTNNITTTSNNDTSFIDTDDETTSNCVGMTFFNVYYYATAVVAIVWLLIL